ncbi:MAG: Gfo/Idh/MocA family protein [Sediminispirochaetaceae bacterium]
MKVRCAVVGLGRIGSTLEKDTLREKPCTHTGAIIDNPDCILTAGADIDAEARRRFQEDRGGSIPVYPDIEALLETGAPELLVAATPPETHRRIVERAAAAGVPVIICEKPLAHTLKDARAIARIHTRGPVRILVNHERRYSADYQMVRRDIAARKYGRLLSVHAVLYFGRTAAHRDVLLHDGTHLVDIINYLTGSRCILRRRFGSMRSCRSSAYLFGRAGEAPVIIDVGAERDHLVFEIQLSFEQGRIRVGNGVLEYEASGPSPFYEEYRSLLPDQSPQIERTGYFANMLADAVRCVREPDYQPASSAVDALEVMRFIRTLRARI